MKHFPWHEFAPHKHLAYFAWPITTVLPFTWSSCNGLIRFCTTCQFLCMVSMPFYQYFRISLPHFFYRRGSLLKQPHDHVDFSNSLISLYRLVLLMVIWLVHTFFCIAWRIPGRGTSGVIWRFAFVTKSEIFQYDDTPTHTLLTCHPEHLHQTFRENLMVWGDPTLAIQSLIQFPSAFVYENPVDSEEDLFTWVLAGAEIIQHTHTHTPCVWKHAPQLCN